MVTGCADYGDVVGNFANPTAMSAAATQIGNFFASKSPGAPILSNIAFSNVTATGATVIWNSNVAADSQVGYSPSTNAYSQDSQRIATLGTTHSVALQGLAPNTLYHVYVRSNLGSPNVLSLSQDFSFTTAAAPVQQRPARPRGLRIR